MTTYLATIRIEAFGLAEAKEGAAWIADDWRALDVVSVVQEPAPLAHFGIERDGTVKQFVPIGGHEDHPLPSAPPRYVTEAVEAAIKAAVQHEMVELATRVAWEVVTVHMKVSHP